MAIYGHIYIYGYVGLGITDGIISLEFAIDIETKKKKIAQEISFLYGATLSLISYEACTLLIFGVITWLYYLFCYINLFGFLLF